MEISDNQKTRDSFLLIDSSAIPKKNSNFSKKYKKIITFDLQSHRVLQMRSVKHHISDEFLEEKELAKIDAECIHFSQWYLNENYNEYLCYDEVNFGSLLKSDFNNFLIPFLRIFLSIKKILEEFPNTTLVCVPHIYKILNSLTNNLQVLDENDFEKNIEINKLQYKITNSISIDISKNNFQKLRKISDIITKVLVKKDNKKNKEKGIALIEFDPVKYETIFTESKQFQNKIFLYNRRRPLTYNRKSLKILQESDVIPYIISNKLLKNNKKCGENKVKEISEKLNEFFEKEKKLEDFFIFSNQKFWDSLKPFLLELLNERILDIIVEIENSKTFLLEKNPSVIIVLSENGITEQILLKLAKKSSIKTILLQHGSMLDSHDAINYNISQGIFPVISDKFFAWNNSSAECVSNLNDSKEKIKIIGSPNIDRIFLQKNNNKKNTNKVLLLVTGPRNQQSIGHSIKEWEKYEKTVENISKIIIKQGMNLVIKQHPDIGEHNFSDKFFEKFSNIEIIKHGDVLDLLLESQYVVSLGFSSTILEAQVIEKPVISLSVDHDVYGIPKSTKDSCLISDVKNFEEQFSYLVKDPEFYKKTIQKGTERLTVDFCNIGNSAKNILKEINKI